MPSFSTILSDIGAGFKKFFGIAIEAATAAEPIVDLLLPGISALYNSAVTEASKVEALAAAAGQQSGTGAQKLALLIAAITPEVLAYAKSQGLPTPTAAQIEAYANAIVASLNAFSTLTTPAA